MLLDATLPVPASLRVWAASWFYDGSAPGPAKTGYGNNCYVMSSKTSHRRPNCRCPV